MINSKISATGEPCVIMELSDLRIGNILEYKGELVHVTSLSMDIDDEYQENIGFCRIGERSNEVSGWTRELCADLKPIELTPNILEKCGFKDRGLYWGLVNDPYPILDFELCFEEGVLYQVGNEAEYSIGEELKYLHELQNRYFSFTNGKELTYTP